MKHLVIGRGEIGEAVVRLLGMQWRVIYTYDLRGGYNKYPSGRVDTMHICFPYSDNFIESVDEYIAAHKPKHIIIWSTVPIGTTKQIKKAVHSPVEGRHPQLVKSIMMMVRWIGSNSKRESKFWEEFFANLHIVTYAVDDSDYTEALKLLSTSEYGAALVFADYKKRVADAVGMDYALVKKWNYNYNKLYWKLGFPQFQKFVLDAPEGKIGGHCVVPNAKLLNKDYPTNVLDEIISMEVK